ncbi:protein kinase [Streptomyces sp. NPDC059168]|uniref:protein kinase domain-containing protein n=1 Tax=Streptomyces sp. NPDC059168 TaxID=3346753 RepID=UPI00367E6E9B
MSADFDDYEQIRPLGRGGAAQVWEAAAPDGTRVAFTFWESLGADPTALRSRIRREAELAARIDHPGVVRLRDARAEAERPFLVFEFLDGPSLEDLVVRSGPLSGAEARDTITGLLRALVEVHAAPVAHLDVKPANVILDNGTAPSPRRPGTPSTVCAGRSSRPAPRTDGPCPRSAKSRPGPGRMTSRIRRTPPGPPSTSARTMSPRRT